MKESFEASPGHIPENVAEQKKNPIEKVMSYLAAAEGEVNRELGEMARDLPPEERLRVSPDFHIIPPPAQYSPEDKKAVEKSLAKHFGSADEAVVRGMEKDKAGFKFEALKTAIMHKNLKSRFFVLRSSRYDDIAHGVDNVLLDKKTGDVVCALDEISGSDLSASSRLDEKRKKVLGINFGGVGGEGAPGDEAPVPGDRGATLSYGPRLQDGVLRAGEMKELPIFLLALDIKRLDEGIRNLDPSPESAGGKYEQLLFRYFMSAISLQIQELKLDVTRYGNMPPDLRARVESFEKFIAETQAAKS